ncbi:MAG: nucleotidyltransferase domain-containing protein [Acidobacteria bacterium]|nr:nucleotidyltransferase domain-containing protein [Acidobacteriota bacterium]
MSPVEILGGRLGAEWPAIRKARETTQGKRREIEAAFDAKLAPDSSLVLFGSIARQEMTEGSDTDWILLVDGQASPSHEDEQHNIAAELGKLGLVQPGRSGVFGCMVGSHDLVHKIGGEDDSNSNTTRRVLLLLESIPIGKRKAYDRVVRQILARYLRDDRGLQFGRGPYRVPRFLVNDLTRYWRTMTVDFVYKQRTQQGRKWALRNAKLRMSRKLIFATGLLRCFFCELDEMAAEAREALMAPPHHIEQMLRYLEMQRALAPLDILARAADLPGVSEETARKLFDSYDRFLSILDDPAQRKELEVLSIDNDEMKMSAVWNEIRRVGKNFQGGLTNLFFEENQELARLTKEYGIF